MGGGEDAGHGPFTGTGPRAGGGEVGLLSIFHPHLLRFAVQRLVVAACYISSMGIHTTLVFVSSAQGPEAVGFK